jgi:starch phosphorylase
MEIGISNDIPTYSGGLGVLAGDIVRASADLRLPMVALTLVSRKGYFRQKITKNGEQQELPDEWDPSKSLF